MLTLFESRYTLYNQPVKVLSKDCLCWHHEEVLKMPVGYKSPFRSVCSDRLLYTDRAHIWWKPGCKNTELLFQRLLDVKLAEVPTILKNIPSEVPFSLEKKPNNFAPFNRSIYSGDCLLSAERYRLVMKSAKTACKFAQLSHKSVVYFSWTFYMFV